MPGKPLGQFRGEAPAFGKVAFRDDPDHEAHGGHHRVVLVDVAVRGGEVGGLHPLPFLAEMLVCMLRKFVEQRADLGIGR